MSRWTVLQHVPFEGPGLIEAEARVRGFELDRRHLYRGDEVPTLEQIGDGVVVLGGPMGADEGDAYPHLLAEQQLLSSVVAAGRPVLGVCLGAQLLARALGAEVWRGEVEEVGLGGVALSEAGRRDPVLGPAGGWLPVLHWHRDTFALPEGAELLASSGLYKHQAFRIGAKAYGLQFHVEVDGALADAMRLHLPDHAVLPARHLRLMERAGRAVVERFFSIAAGAGARPACSRSTT